MLHLPPSGGVHVQSGWCKAREEGGVHQRNGGITTMLIPRSPGLPRGMGPPCPRRGSPSCEIRVVLTRVFSRPKISAWVPLGRRGEYGGVTYVSVSGCPFRWITPLFYPCLQMPGYPPYGVMLPDIRERWSGGIKYDGGSGGDGGSVGRAGTEACRIPISQSEREHFFDECGVNESFCDGHQLRLRGVVVGNIGGGPITPALGLL